MSAGRKVPKNSQMTTAFIDPYPIAELTNRYAIGKQAVYNRLDALGIRPTKQGNRSYITPEQLKDLDDLHTHLQAGGTMADFSGAISSETPANSQLVPVDTRAIEPTQDFIALIESIARHLKPADPLAHLASLERAADSGWLLTSAEVKQLIGAKPVCKKGENSVTRGSFTFVKSGKIGNQTAWRVLKVHP